MGKKKEKKERYEVILAGSGGQGLVLSGIMLAEAAILEGKNVVQSVSYGIASRGGFSMAGVIIDREEIIFQEVENADVVLALTEEAMEKFQALSEAGAAIVYDTTLLKPRTGKTSLWSTLYRHGEPAGQCGDGEHHRPRLHGEGERDGQDWRALRR